MAKAIVVRKIRRPKGCTGSTPVLGTNIYFFKDGPQSCGETGQGLFHADFAHLMNVGMSLQNLLEPVLFQCAHPLVQSGTENVRNWRVGEYVVFHCIAIDQ